MHVAFSSGSYACCFVSQDWEEMSEKLGSNFDKSSVVGVLSEEVLRRAKRYFDNMFKASTSSARAGSQREVCSIFLLLVIAEVRHEV